MLDSFKKFFEALKALVAAHPILFFVFLLIVVVFISTPFLWVYRTVRANVPGAAAVTPAK